MIQTIALNKLNRRLTGEMHTNGNNIEHIEFITFIKSARQRSSTAAQLRHENAELIRIIADFDTRLATVEAERDELKWKLDMRHVLKMICEYNPLRNDRDAFIQELCEYGLGDIDEEPKPADFGLPIE